MPNSLIDTVRRERAKYGPTLTTQQEVDICNAVAWTHRADGWGLSRKPSGNHGTLSNSTPVATDILYHQPSQTVYDVLVGDDRHAGFNLVTKYDFAGRPWVAPVPPTGDTPPVVQQPVVVTPPPPQVDLSAIFAQLNALAARVDALERAPQPVVSLEGRVAALEAATYEASGQTSRTFGHAHSVTLAVRRNV